MKKSFASKVAPGILMVVFAIIIASFLFSGFDKIQFGGITAKEVATVDGTPITNREYQMALQRQVQFYDQMMGGKGLTAKQLEQMGIKQSVLNGLIQQKMILNTARELGFVVSLDEIKGEIKNMPYFKKGEQFDVNLYRNMLQSNGYIPQQFEELVGDDLIQKKVDELFSTTLVSENYVKDVQRFKNHVVVIEGVRVGRQSLAPLITVSEAEIKDYIAKPENKKNLEEIYTENFAKYNTSAEVKARHILIKGTDEKALEKITAIRNKVTPKNFGEIAKKETQDPSGKDNGGNLDWFAAGRMVPEFEKVAFAMKKGEISRPVKTPFGYHLIFVEDTKPAVTKKVDDVKEELARIALQKSKSSNLDALLKSEQARLTADLKAGKISEIEAYAKKVDGQTYKATEINQFDQQIAHANLSPIESEKIFQAKEGEVIDFTNPGAIFLIKVVSKKTAPEADAEKLKTEVASQSQQLSRKVREELLKAMNNKAKIVTNKNLL